MAETKITSNIMETTNLNGTINAEVNGMQQQVMTMSCVLTEKSVANIQTFVSNQDLFLNNVEAVKAEVDKFKAKATEVANGLNSYIF